MSGEYWYQSDDPGKEAWNSALAIKQDQEYRIRKGEEFIALYEGREFGLDEEELRYNLSRAACDTIHAEISGRQKPVPKFQTSGADWKTKRKAKQLEKFMLAYLAQRQGQYLNAHELMEDVFLDCSVTGTGVAKVFADTYKKRVVIERHFDGELFTDPVEARYGNPKSLFHVFMMDKAQALAEFVPDDSEESKKIRFAIEGSRKYNSRDTDKLGKQNDRVACQIEVVEAWRVSCGNEPGLHVFAINGETVFSEEYTKEFFPFVFVTWERERRGFWGIGLVEQGAPIQKELNDNAAKLQERFRLCGNKRTFYEQGSLDEDFLKENEAETLIPVKPGAQLPKESTPSPIADAENMWLESQYAKYFSITGVSEMRASARKDPGVTAGVAIRTLNDMQTARFSLKAKAYENSFVSLTHLVLDAMADLHAAGIKVATGKNSDEIKWSEVNLPDDAYDITIAPTSSLPNEPAGRMQMISELYEMQLIGQETFKQLLGWPDLEKEMNYQTSQARYLEKVLDRILDGEPAEAFDTHIVDKNRALIVATQSYFEALYDDAPEDVLGQMRLFIQQINYSIQTMNQAILEQQAMAPQPMGAPAAGAPIQ